MSTCKLKFARELSSPVVLLLLAACGGGGGGGGGSASAVQYSGNTNVAVLTTANASSLAATVFGGNNAAINSSVTGVSAVGASRQPAGNVGVADLSRRLHGDFRGTLQRMNAILTGAEMRTAVAVNETEPCDSGSVQVTGDLSNAGTGTLTFDFNACRTGDETLSGRASVRVDAFDQIFGLPTDFTFSFSRLALRGPGVSSDAGGSVHTLMNILAKAETTTDNIVYLNNFTGGMTKTENFVYVTVYDSILSPNSGTTTANGRLFDSVQGYVDVATVTPFFFGGVSDNFPRSGQMLMTAGGNRSARVTALSGTLAALALDLDADNIFEVNATLKWTELAGAAGADLADSDHDGMNNSWETAHGLDPNNPADAALDKDGDGASNLVEYLAGTDPGGGSAPPPVNLSLIMSGSQNPAAIGADLFYTLLVRNNSVDNLADNVVVTDTLPVGVTFVSAIPQRGVCTGTGPVTCNLGRLTLTDTVAVTIHVTPTTEGVITNNATVTTTSFDPDPANNSASSATTIGRSTAVIQNLIDNAAAGAVVPVAAGTYVGNLNFNGKNVTLQSVAGPANTVLDGGQTTIGPGGGIKGFHIIVRSTLAMSVIGSGSLVSGNIFEGSSVGTGVNAQAIVGNVASPTIERNIFRNIPCNSPTLSVVGFVNNSSPVITNNVFENNPCRAIDLTLPQLNTPQVVNNTFVGNAVAIHVDRRVPQTTQVYRNNLIVQNGVGLEIELSSTDADNPVWMNNLVFGNTADYVGTASQTGTGGNISSNPLFVSGGAGDYHLLPGSPAIDAGSAAGAPGVDLDGSPRPVDGNGDSTAAFDIGAFEAH